MRKERYVASWLTEHASETPWRVAVYGREVFDTRADARLHAVQASISEWARVSLEVLLQSDGPAPYWQDAGKDEFFIGKGPEDVTADGNWELRSTAAHFFGG